MGRCQNWSVPGASEAFLWTPGGGMVSLGDGSADGVSPDGLVVVGSHDFGLGSEAFRWTSTTGMVGLGDLPGGAYWSGASAVSGDGSVVVGSSASTSGYEAFRWTGSGGMVGLGDLPGGTYSGGANDVSANGSVVVGGSRTDLGTEAFRWTAATGMVGLGYLPPEYGDGPSNAAAVSADGSVIVGHSGIFGFVWTPEGGMRRVSDVLIDGGATNVMGWHLQNAFGVSADGTLIVGGGTSPEGDYVAWMARIPEPTTLTILIAGSLIGLRRRKRSAA
ncbi:MAG TPA: PEP-CTERM sorting domain-containing protein [Phycisphaerae bacterium]|nr:PEP-CTERM sorting domain-containing protein [Phycisphaerae bacterium]